MRCAIPLMLLTLAACGEGGTVANAFDPQVEADKQAARERVADRRAVEAGFQPEQPEPLAMTRIDPVSVATPGTALPPATDAYRYLGRWAATPILCRDSIWRFETRKLSTAGATTCKFETVAAVPTGYEMPAVCESDGRKTEQQLKLHFNEYTRTMRVEGQTVGPVDLIYCGA